MNPLFNSQVFQILEKSLDSSALRQKVISNNIANVNTPKFKRSDVHFEEELAKVLDKKSLKLAGTDEQHIGIKRGIDKIAPKIIPDQSTTMRTDDNNVDIDAEMVHLAQNQIYYDALVQRINGKFGSLRTVITEGRR